MQRSMLFVVSMRLQLVSDLILTSMIELIILSRPGIADCAHVLVAKAEYFPQVWTLAWLLVLTV